MSKGKGKDSVDKSLDRVLAQNKRARHDYELSDRYEAGLVLIGSEARSLRDLAPNLTDSFVDIDRNGEAWVMQMRIQPLSHAAFAHTETRPRKLLLHDYEIAKLRAATEREGMTLIPTRLYYKKGKAKLEVAVAQGLKRHDKREAIKTQTAEREARAAIARARKDY
jgi:SsrA-binding protein